MDVLYANIRWCSFRLNPRNYSGYSGDDHATPALPAPGNRCCGRMRDECDFAHAVTRMSEHVYDDPQRADHS